MPETQQQNMQAESSVIELNDFENLLEREFRPKTEEAKSAVQQAVGTLARRLSARRTSSPMMSSPRWNP